MIEVIGFIGYGGQGSVFLVNYNGTKSAMKLQYGYQDDFKKQHKRGRDEFEYLKRLNGIEGIPAPISELTDYHGTFNELGLNASGKKLREVISSPCNFDDGDFKPYFCGGFIYQYIKDATKFYPREDMVRQPKTFFDGLDNLVIQVHEKGISLPVNLDIFEANGKPYIFDWTEMEDFETKRYGGNESLIVEMKQTDKDLIRQLRSRHQKK